MSQRISAEKLNFDWLDFTIGILLKTNSQRAFNLLTLEIFFSKQRKSGFIY